MYTRRVFVYGELIGIHWRCARVFVGGVSYAYARYRHAERAIGFVLASKPGVGETVTFERPKREPPKMKEGSTLKPLKYYNPAIHSAAFVLLDAHPIVDTSRSKRARVSAYTSNVFFRNVYIRM